jgi:hypothetical protein
MRNGVEIWAESDRLSGLVNALQNIKESKFIEYDGQLINTADITGIFNAETMAEYTRRKNGDWKCDQGNWHQRGEKCKCKEWKNASDIYGKF